MPARWQRATASATWGAGGSSSATSPRRQRSRSASSRSAGAVPSRGALRRRPARAGPAPRSSPPARPGTRARRRRAHARRPSLAERWRCSARAATSRCALDVQPPGRRRDRSSVVMSLRRGRSGNARRGARAGLGRRCPRRGRARHAAGRSRSGRRIALPAVERDARCCSRRRPRASAARGAVGRPSRRPPSGDELARRRPRARSTSMRFSVSVPVLSVQMTSVAPRVSTALRRFTSAPRARQATDADRQRERDRRQQTLRHVAPRAARWRRRPRRRAAARRRAPSGTNASPATTAIERDEPRDAADLPLQRAVVVLDALGERGDAAELGGHAGRLDDRRAPRRRCSSCR